MRWRGASFFKQATASMGMRRGKAALNTRPPLAQCDGFAGAGALHRALLGSAPDTPTTACTPQET
eukprot:scaffold65037_cov30-Phaeocystis_antarctica.AAC.1